MVKNLRTLMYVNKCYGLKGKLEEHDINVGSVEGTLHEGNFINSMVKNVG